MTPQITVSGVKRKLIGLGPWLEKAAALADYTDDYIQSDIIPSVLREFERKTLFRLRPAQVVSAPDGTYNPPSNSPQVWPVTEFDGTVADYPVIIQPGQHMTVQESYEFFHIPLQIHPVQKIQRVRMIIGTINAFTVPTAWFTLDQQTGILHLLPVMGPMLSNAMVGVYQLISSFQGLGYIPNAIKADYVAGLPSNWGSDPEWADLKRSLEEMVAHKILIDIAHLPDAGQNQVQVSGGGTSETISYTRFVDRKAELAAAEAEFIGNFKAQETPFTVGWV